MLPKLSAEKPWIKTWLAADGLDARVTNQIRLRTTFRSHLAELEKTLRRDRHPDGTHKSFANAGGFLSHATVYAEAADLDSDEELSDERLVLVRLAST